MMKVEVFVFNPFMENTFVIYDDTKKCIIVDPGCDTPDEKAELNSFVSDNKLLTEKIVNTHCHVDHVFGVKHCVDQYKTDFLVHEQEVPILERVDAQGMMFGLQVQVPPKPSILLKNNDEISFGNSSFKVLHVPGHSAGSVALYSEADRLVVVGDVLFQGSVGRSDLPSGDHETLIRSINEKLLSLPDDVVVYPGHGPSTTIGEERKSNPFLQ